MEEFYKQETINENHVQIIEEDIKSLRTVDHELPIEAMDIKDMETTRLGKISAIVGDRVHVSYCRRDMRKRKGWWFSYKSDLIHKFGWSQAVGVCLKGVIPNIPTGISFDFPSYPSEINIEG